MKTLKYTAGKLCKAPAANQARILSWYRESSSKICTLSSIDLLETISRSSLMNKVLIAGRLLSENKGIDAMITFAMSHPELKLILVCGKEVKGHRPGKTLLALASNGVDSSGRILEQYRYLGIKYKSQPDRHS